MKPIARIHVELGPVPRSEYHVQLGAQYPRGPFSRIQRVVVIDVKLCPVGPQSRLDSEPVLNLHLALRIEAHRVLMDGGEIDRIEHTPVFGVKEP
jgi:hypothetical protein